MLSLEHEAQNVVVVLALPLLWANGGNCLKPDEMAERPVRYRQRWRDVRNTFGDDTRQIAVMQPELTLRFAHQNNSDYLTCFQRITMLGFLGSFRSLNDPDMVNNTWKQVLKREDLDPDKPRILQAGNNHLTLPPLKDD